MPWTDAVRDDPYSYHEGFGNYVTSEAVKGALPPKGNNPQKCPYGLYAEQLSGTAFTAPRGENRRSWLYRIRPSVGHSELVALTRHTDFLSSFSPTSPNISPTPAQLRWSPFSYPIEGEQVDFVAGIKTLAGAGEAQTGMGMAVHIYTANTDMIRTSFYNSDGDFLIVPQEGRLDVRTEFGSLRVHTTEIAIIQRGMRFSVALPDGQARGYILETYKGHLALPELGPIGANSLAEPRDFKSPVASFEDVDEQWTLINKFMGSFYAAELDHSPYDVVAFHGNYMPYKYDLKLFTAVGSITHDHPDPSIFTVLTCKSDTPGTAIADFVIFPPRWLVAENTFRPPWFHRNCMTELMGMIEGEYDGKSDGFLPGGASLHSMNTPHGPDAAVFRVASEKALKPEKVGEGSLAFMFESCFQLATTKWAIGESGKVQQDVSQSPLVPLRNGAETVHASLSVLQVLDGQPALLQGTETKLVV